MAQTAAHLVDHVIPPVPVRQWVLSLPIPLRLLLASQPMLVTPVLQVVHRVITRHPLGQVGLKADEAVRLPVGRSCTRPDHPATHHRSRGFAPRAAGIACACASQHRGNGARSRG